MNLPALSLAKKSAQANVKNKVGGFQFQVRPLKIELNSNVPFIPPESFARIDVIGLGRGREDLLEARELRVVDVEQAIAMGTNQGIQWARPTVAAFHGSRDFTTIVTPAAIHTLKEQLKFLGPVDQFKLIK